MVRHIIGGIETIGIIAAVGVIIERSGISGGTSAPGGSDKEVKILRHFVLRCLGCSIVENLPLRFWCWPETERKAGFMKIAQPC